MRTWTPLLAACLLVACSSPLSSDPAPPEKGLPEVTQIIDMELATGEHVYILEYRTSLPINDVTALVQEAETLWPTLRPKSEGAGHSSAGIRAVESASGGIVEQAQAYTFIWERDSSGIWQRLPSEG